MSHPYSKAHEILKVCWEGYKMVGTKKKGNRTVPNCVPEKKAEEAPEESKKQERIAGGTVAVPSAGGMLARAEQLLEQMELRKNSDEYKFEHNVTFGDEDIVHWLTIKDKNGRKVGSLCATQVPGDPYLFTQDIHVAPEHQRKGLATKAHQILERKLGMKFRRSHWETDEGSKLWEGSGGGKKFGIDYVPEDEFQKDEKKYSKKVTNPETGRDKTVRYGAKGYTIAPGTSRGDSYCARSAGQMKDHPAAAKDPNSPLRLSRKKWKCSGSKSTKKSEEDVIEVDPAEYLAKAQELLSILRKSTDHEYAGRMVKGNLYKLAETAQKLYPLFQDDENVEPWVEEKIAVAASMMDSVAHYMEHEAVADGKAPDETGIVTGE